MVEGVDYDEQLNTRTKQYYTCKAASGKDPKRPNGYPTHTLLLLLSCHVFPCMLERSGLDATLPIICPLGFCLRQWAQFVESSQKLMVDKLKSKERCCKDLYEQGAVYFVLCLSPFSPFAVFLCPPTFPLFVHPPTHLPLHLPASLLL
jgi:hypothetical protein